MNLRRNRMELEKSLRFKEIRQGESDGAFLCFPLSAHESYFVTLRHYADPQGSRCVFG